MGTTAHEHVVAELVEHLQPLFDASPDGVYVWLDEEHWSCSARFAALFGYTSDELENRPGFLDVFVHEEDRGMFSWNYWNRVQAMSFPATFRFRGLHRDGSVLQLETDMIPLTYGGHVVAYHFVRKVG